MKLKEMTKEQVQKVLDNLDWIEIHRISIFGDYGETINIFTDGTLNVLGSGTTYQDYSEVLGCVSVQGRGNVDEWPYLDGWGEWDQYTHTFITKDGRTLTEEEAIEEAIEDGEWDEWIESEKQSIMNEFLENEKRYEE